MIWLRRKKFPIILLWSNWTIWWLNFPSLDIFWCCFPFRIISSLFSLYILFIANVWLKKNWQMSLIGSVLLSLLGVCVCVCVRATWLRALVPSPKSLLGLPSWSITEFSTKKVRQKEREVERGSERGRKGEREVERGSELILWLLLWKLISVIRLTTFGATDSLPRRHKRTRSTHLVSRLAC